MGRFSFKNKIFSAVSGHKRLRSVVKISPAVLNKRSTSTEVGGGVKYFAAKSEANLSSTLLLFDFSRQKSNGFPFTIDEFE